MPDFGHVITRSNDFINPQELIWDENSPLPPAVRYIELADVYVRLASPYDDAPNRNIIHFFGLDDTCLPRDSLGRIRRNLKSCGVDVSGFNFVTFDLLPTGAAVAATLGANYADDSMWTGEVVDPMNWQDDFWDFVGLNRTRMAIYLEEHPGSRLNA